MDVLTDEQLSALLTACKGSEFTERRDTALIWLLVDTGICSSELLGLAVTTNATPTCSAPFLPSPPRSLA